MATLIIRNVPGDVIGALDRLADQEDRSRESYIRQLLAEHTGEEMMKRIKDNLERGLWCNYRADYVATAWYDLGAAALSPDDLSDPELGAYVIQYHKGEMPAFDAKRFHKLEDLVEAMREVQPDLRKWKLAEIE